MTKSYLPALLREQVWRQAEAPARIYRGGVIEQKMK